MRRRRQLLLPASALGTIAVIAACSGDGKTGDDSIRSAHVELALFKANGVRTGTCSGVLVSPTRVLTAGHCVAGFSSWKVTSPGAQVAVTARKGFTYDWETTVKSQPRLHDVAVVILDEPITLREYPTIAAKGLESTPAVRMRNVGGEFEMVQTQATSAKSLGFNHHYALKLEAGETLETGGALMTPDGRMVLGIVHGQGATSKTLFATRVDSTARWVADRLKCSARMNPVTATVACYKSDAGVCLEHGPDCPNSRRDAGGIRDQAPNTTQSTGQTGTGSGTTTGTGTPGSGTGTGGTETGSGSGSGTGTGSGSGSGSGTGSGAGGASGSGTQVGVGSPGSCDEYTLITNGSQFIANPGSVPTGGFGTGSGSGGTDGLGGTGTGGTQTGSPGTTGSGGTGTGSGTGSGTGTGGTGTGGTETGSPGLPGSGGAGSGSGGSISGGATGAVTSTWGFPGIGPGGGFKAVCHGAGCGSLPGGTGTGSGTAISPGTQQGNPGGLGTGSGSGSGAGGASTGGSITGTAGAPGTGGFGSGDTSGLGTGAFGTGSGSSVTPGLPGSGGTGSTGGSGSGTGGTGTGSGTAIGAGAPGSGGTGSFGGSTDGTGSGTTGGTGTGGSVTGTAGTPGSGGTSGSGTTATTASPGLREGPGCYGISSCVDQIINYGNCCSEPTVGGASATAPAPIK